jgi:hypothetical protein
MEGVMVQNEDGYASVEVTLTVGSNRCIALVACNPQRQNRSPDMSIEDRESVTEIMEAAVTWKGSWWVKIHPMRFEISP